MEGNEKRVWAASLLMACLLKGSNQVNLNDLVEFTDVRVDDLRRSLSCAMAGEMVKIWPDKYADCHINGVEVESLIFQIHIERRLANG